MLSSATLTRSCSRRLRVANESALHRGLLEDEIRHEPILGEVLVHLLLQSGLLIVGVHRGRRGALVEALGLQPRVEAGQVGLGSQQELLGLVHQLARLRVVQNQHHRLRCHDGAGPDDDALHTPLGSGGNPTARFVNRDQRAEPADLTQHRASLDGVDPDGRAFDGWGGGLQSRQHDRHESHRQEPGDGKRHLLELLFPSDGSGSLNVHERIALLDEMNRSIGWQPVAARAPLVLYHESCQDLFPGPTD